MIHTKTFEVTTRGRDDFLDITSMVARAVSESGISRGLLSVYVPHTTAGVTINENADPDGVHDILAALDEAVPWRQDFYRHGEGNSAAHVKSSMMGCQTVIPIADGQLTLGTWQSVYFTEFDGPRTRRVVVTIMGD
jgi:secondary thiamine-phosphate synthase enzyme